MSEGGSEKTINSAPKFGTFLGVYTPSVLTILGLIMYLRFGWVVGNVGLPVTILIVLLASSITFITALSASAIATNMRVGAGGEYYLVSHSLGLELGGAIGIPLFLCRTLSITFYCFGLAESIVSLWPSPLPDYTIQLIAAVTIIVITVVAGRSAELALKLQIPIMIAVGLSLLALIIGVFTAELRAPELAPTYRTAPEGFWYVFAVFFPAVTGFTAGIGMSGDLKNPRRSIPKGTLLAVVTGTVIYITIPILLSMTTRMSFEALAEPGVIVWSSIAVFGALLVYPGVWGAILSSAFGSVLGGPRVLQALANDGLAPKRFAKLSNTGQPTTATWVSGAIALAAVALGGLNTIAQFVTILFLTLYVTINLSAAMENIVGDPSYRPTINVPWYVCLLGAAGAISVMFLISPLACVFAVILELVLYFYLRRRAYQKSWGDVRAGFWMALARFALLKLKRHKPDPRNWRPHILLFSGNPAKRIGLVRLANWFNQNRGVVTACQLVEGDLKKEKASISELLSEMDEAIESAGLTAFSEVDVVPDLENGVISITQANGIAGLQSNTVMFGWPKEPPRLEAMLRIVRATARAGKSAIIARLNWAHEPGQRTQIDIWWGGLQNNGDMMLMLAYLLSLNPEWQDARIVVRSVVDGESERIPMKESLDELMPDLRINADTEVIVRQGNETIAEIVARYSQNSDVTFLGLNDPKEGTEAEYAQRLYSLCSGLKTTIFVRNASEFAGRLV